MILEKCSLLGNAHPSYDGMPDEITEAAAYNDGTKADSTWCDCTCEIAATAQLLRKKDLLLFLCKTAKCFDKTNFFERPLTFENLPQQCK